MNYYYYYFVFGNILKLLYVASRTILELIEPLTLMSFKVLVVFCIHFHIFINFSNLISNFFMLLLIFFLALVVFFFICQISEILLFSL